MQALADKDKDPLLPLFLGEGASSDYSCRLKHALKKMIAGGTPTSSNEAYWTTSEDPAGVPWVAISDMTRAFRICSTEKSVTEAGIQAARLTKLPIGTILYSIYASLGKTAILEIEAVTNQAILGLVPNETKVCKKFLGWWLAHVEPMVSLLSSSNTQSNLNAEKVEDIPLLAPPLPTQKAIANFLDRKTAAIDALIEKKENLLELLAEKRSALINQAVTKGMDPTAPMKDSGIPWIGEIPEHWEVRPLGYRVSMQGGSTPSKQEERFWGGDIPWVSPKDMKRFEIGDSIDKLTEDALRETSIRLVEPGATLVVVRGMILARTLPVGLSVVPCTINQDMKAIVPGKGLDARYLSWQLDARTQEAMSLIEEAGHGTKTFRTDLCKRCFAA